MDSDVLSFLMQRRSAKVALLAEPGPDPSQLEQILAAGARVPDHKKLAPWRFVIFEGDGRARFGERLAEICAKEEAEPPSAVRLETERGRLLRAPVVVAVISQIREKPGAPEWEQILSCGASCFNICLAANALGFGTAWITEWYSYSPGVREILRLLPHERIAGFIYIGTNPSPQADRDRPALADIVSRWSS